MCNQPIRLPCRIMPRPATLEELLLRQLRDFAESSGLADVVPVEATLASAELLQMGVEQAEETKLKLQVVARLGGGPHDWLFRGFEHVGQPCSLVSCPARGLPESSLRRLLNSSATRRRAGLVLQQRDCFALV